jgi:hypothetical protein
MIVLNFQIKHFTIQYLLTKKVLIFSYINDLILFYKSVILDSIYLKTHPNG